MSTLSDTVGALSNDAAAWYNAFQLGTPVVSSPAVAASTSIAIQQQAQANLNAQNPFLAGLLANPVVWVIIAAAIVALLIWAAR